jgi:hypothetical protein
MISHNSLFSYLVHIFQMDVSIFLRLLYNFRILSLLIFCDSKSFLHFSLFELFKIQIKRIRNYYVLTVKFWSEKWRLKFSKFEFTIESKLELIKKCLYIFIYFATRWNLFSCSVKKTKTETASYFMSSWLKTFLLSFFSRFQSFRQKCECETFGKHSFKAQHIFALK